MLTFFFDSQVFSTPASEENIFLAVSAMTEFSSKEDFCKAAIDNELQKRIMQLKKLTWSALNPDAMKKQIQTIEDGAEELKDSMNFKPISPDDDVAKYLENLYSINPTIIVIEHGAIKNIYEIFQSEWDDVCLFFEADDMYYYFHWLTTA
jgi:hypothetical protein